jgi:Sec-independent protein secretion pathway component TatC
VNAPSESRSRRATEMEYGLCRRTVCFSFILFVLHSDLCVFLFLPMAFGFFLNNTLSKIY